MNIAGISIYTTDIFLLVLLGRLFLVKQSELGYIYKKEVPIYLYMLFVIVSLFRGILSSGFNSDLVGDIRKFGGFIIAILYFSQLPIKINNKHISFLRNTMRLVFIYCCVCWISALFLRIYITPNRSLRCLGSDYAFIFSMWTLYCCYEDLVVKKKHMLSFETCAYVLGIIVLQHNSVYAAFAIGMFLIIICNYKETLLKHPKWIMQVFLVIILLIILLVMNPNSALVENLVSTFDKFSQATADTAEGTIGTRYIIWTGLIKTLNGVFDWCFGKPMGIGYHVAYLDTVWEVSPHSGYIENLMRVGLLGLVSLVGYILFLIRKNIKNRYILGASILAAILVYLYPYSMTPEIGLIIGMNMALLSKSKRINIFA